MDESLRRAALEGNVVELYASIEKEGNVLRIIDEMEFIDNPLHVAASEGCTNFAMEIMNLKPSLATKLNQEGLSPIHLAVEKGNNELAIYLIENNKDLIRLKGKKGETPFHYAVAKEGNLDLLTRFLEACPECILDMTAENQTALHIAATNKRLEALQLVCQTLRKTDYCKEVVNYKDRNGDTALHIAARNNQPKMLRLLLKSKANKLETNRAGSTALAIARECGHRESIKVLRGWPTESFLRIQNLQRKLVVRNVTKASEVVFRGIDNISEEDRNALLVILALLLTATYQASITPPGSVWQGSASSNSTSGNNQIFPGKSVMNEVDFLTFYIPAYTVFMATFFLTLGLLKPYPRGFRTALQILLAFLAISFDQAVSFISPSYLTSFVLRIFSVSVFLLMMFMSIAYRVSKISVLILGCWLFPGLYGPFRVGSILIIVCWFFIGLYDPFWISAIPLLVLIAFIYELFYIKAMVIFYVVLLVAILPILFWVEMAVV